MDLTKMTVREFAAGLMRGDAADYKMGYGPEAAAHTVADSRKLDDEERAKLLAYADGFHDGMWMAMAADRDEEVERPALANMRHKRGTIGHFDYHEGALEGGREDGTLINPARRVDEEGL